MAEDKVSLDVVMAGLVPAIHVSVGLYKDVDARHKLAAGPATSGRTRLAGHDDEEMGHDEKEPAPFVRGRDDQGRRSFDDESNSR